MTLDWEAELSFIEEEEVSGIAAQSTETYESFLSEKLQYGSAHGFEPIWTPSFPMDFQALAIDWTLRQGRSALFLDCGMGKTICEFVWGENVSRKTGKPVLLLTPLAVAQQMIAEAAKFDIDLARSKDGTLPGTRIVVSNYERLHYFKPSDFAGVICDESSCLKNFAGKRRAQITEFLRTIPYRLLCTATAAPNDYTELGTTSEALGELGHIDMLNRFFKNDNNTSDTKLLRRRALSRGGPVTAGWRFKGHAEIAFWRYFCSIARAGRRPSDLGDFSDEKFILPELIENEHIVETQTLAPGWFFPMAATNLQEEREELRRTLRERCEKAASLIDKRTAMIWCHLNDEGDLLEKLIPGARQIAGKTPEDQKEELFSAFQSGQLPHLIIKDKIGAWGLNSQHCGHVVRFATHSYEADYQAVRRCLRFGRKDPVVVDRVATEGQAGITANMKRKAVASDRMFTELVRHMKHAQGIDKFVFAEEEKLPVWL